MTYMRLSVLATITAAFVAAWTPMAAAQTPPPQQQAPAATQTFPEEKLKSYAVAVLQVEQIKQSYKPQMEAAQTAQDRHAIDSEAMQKQVEAVRKEGLSVKEYNEITEATKTNGEVASKVQTLMTQAAQ
jgi:hypothetical protein